MGTNGNERPPDYLQTPPVESQRIERLESRIRALEDTINLVRGIGNILKWLVPPVLIVGGGVILFMLGRLTSEG